MILTDNTILITGGGSGIGRALAETLHAKSNTVIIAGRRENALMKVTKANPGMHYETLDIESTDSINTFAKTLLTKYPNLNVVIHNAGIMQYEVAGQDDVKVAEHTIATNLLGPIRLNSVLLSTLKAQPHATIMTVSSGLAFVPLAPFATYCATKAAVHSYTQSLRYQLKDTNVQVIELTPPYVQTELTGPQQATDPHAMPLKDFIAEAIGIIEHDQNVTEILVKPVLPQRTAEASGDYNKFFTEFNDAMAGLWP